MEEYFDTFTIDGKPMGVKLKSFCHSAKPNIYHKPVWIWIYNDAGQILVQKRSANKKNFPGFLICHLPVMSTQVKNLLTHV